ncbi:MAG: hypothetical protein RLZZ171_2922 [Cyanobacteriota bacterium]|jgi:hypothetical protein
MSIFLIKLPDSLFRDNLKDDENQRLAKQDLVKVTFTYKLQIEI